jgi:hypothetical protein
MRFVQRLYSEAGREEIVSRHELISGIIYLCDEGQPVRK